MLLGQINEYELTQLLANAYIKNILQCLREDLQSCTEAKKAKRAAPKDIVKGLNYDQKIIAQHAIISNEIAQGIKNMKKEIVALSSKIKAAAIKEAKASGKAGQSPKK